MSRKRRLAAVLVLALVVALSLTLFASAAVDGVGGGFSLWNLLDGLGGLFIDLINSISKFITNLISAIKNLGNMLLDAIAGIVRAIVNAISYLLSALKTLFIPNRESFSRFRDDILTTFDKKFGSVFSALDYLNTRFKGLKAKNGLTDSFKIVFPKNSFLYGISIDLLVTPRDVLSFIRFCLTGFCCLVTGLTCCHKVIAMVKQ